MHEVMEATRQAGIKLNYDKCVTKTKSCSLCGNIYTPAGVKPDPEKEEAIKKMEAPINKQQLQSFLGMMTYLGQFEKKDIFLQVDASIQGLGAASVQKDQQGRLKPVAYVSKSLTDAEKRYSNIEHELLAVVFGCIRFHHYLYARKFECHSNHIPLEDIHLKHLNDALQGYRDYC